MTYLNGVVQKKGGMVCKAGCMYSFYSYDSYLIIGMDVGRWRSRGHYIGLMRICCSLRDFFTSPDSAEFIQQYLPKQMTPQCAQETRV